MRANIQLIIHIFLGVMLSCTPADTPSKLNRKKLSGEITSMFHQYVAQLNQMDLTDLQSYFSDNPDFYWIEEGILRYPTKQKLIESLKSFYPNLEASHMEYENEHIYIIDENYATLSMQFQQKIEMKSGFGFEIKGVLSVLLLKENGRWTFLSGHTSTINPNAPKRPI